MKNLKRLTCLVIMIFMISAFVLTGCGGLKDNPAINATVYSNGGMSVIKGDYLYYVNLLMVKTLHLQLKMLKVML